MKKHSHFRFRKKKDDKLRNRFYDMVKFEEIGESDLIRKALYFYLFKEDENEIRNFKNEKINFNFEFENNFSKKEISDEDLEGNIGGLLDNF